MADETKSRVLPIVMGAGVAVLIGAAVVAFLPAPEPDVIAAAPVAAPVDDTVAPAPDVLAAAPEPAAPMTPSFDTFRVERDGAMVIAGRAEPGQVVDIILAGEAIARVTADGAGAFVALPAAGPSDVPRRLILMADPDGAQIASDTSYIVAPIAPPGLAEGRSPDATRAPEPVTTTEADAPIAPPATDVAEAVEEVVQTPPTVLEADADGIRIAQSAPSLAPPNVALDAITYDPTGEVQLAGRATGDGARRREGQSLARDPRAGGRRLPRPVDPHARP